ncbi:glycoside hydrolase family 2 protein [Ilyonectria robusta]|uniref:glycoside hydrolase family 2 protein n=1 Tax=Ilyonectria robusta TaxID=1079257 RepID=UPI001E8D2D10|nr:glycoside hydrolase family 2 protein [Ilyonectria robusta]KAH8650699.1 glycoside hydrolase family 2 protein [Ilyonectria robusta]
MVYIRRVSHALLSLGLLLSANQLAGAASVRSPGRDQQEPPASCRERDNLNSGWRFWRSETNPDGLIYDQRPDLANLTDATTLKSWILPSANRFIRDPTKHHQRPKGHPGSEVPYVQNHFDDSNWEDVTLPHDWAIKGPFYTEPDDVAIIDSRMGRLPVHGVGWYRRKLHVSHEDKGKKLYLEIDGSMSYTMVWLNGELVGGWPFGYNSFRLDLTPYVELGKENQLAIRLDNPRLSSRWYPGGGIYRSVWLSKVATTHVGQYGTFITTKDVSTKLATLDLVVEVENDAKEATEVQVETSVHVYDAKKGQPDKKVADFPRATVKVDADGKKATRKSVKIKHPKLWGPPPTQTPNLYAAVTKIYNTHGKEIDSYTTQFGIRSVEFTSDDGLLVNGERIQFQGVNEHHDLGSIGAAFNLRAATRKLDALKEMGVNSIRMSHNPPATELLELTDKMGFLVIDEIFDCWKTAKRDNDYHLVWDDWHEPDLRAFIRRDRNHPSIIIWSFGNEVREQRNDSTAPLVYPLKNIILEEDTTRPATVSLSHVRPGTPGAALMDASDILSVNYQGAGISDGPNYVQVRDNASYTPPAYPLFHKVYPGKLLVGSETASSVSSRGTYIFPVTLESAPVNETSGGNATLGHVSAYELYTSDAGSSPDKVFASERASPFVSGGLVWTGWDYLGEPTPYNTSRSSYFGIIDMAGFKKDRFFMYQSQWRPDLPMAHLLPHWTWPDREGKVTPVHVFTSGDEAELFLNKKSLGRKKKGDQYRLRWDDVKYAPGELHVVAYKGGKKWAEDTVRTAGEAAAVRLTADRTEIDADGYDLSFISAEVVDKNGNVVPEASHTIRFSQNGPGEIIATDNGNAASLVSFASLEKKAFSGKALAIVRSTRDGKGAKGGKITVSAEVDGLKESKVTVRAN